MFDSRVVYKKGLIFITLPRCIFLYSERYMVYDTTQDIRFGSLRLNLSYTTLAIL